MTHINFRFLNFVLPLFVLIFLLGQGQGFSDGSDTTTNDQKKSRPIPIKAKLDNPVSEAPNLRRRGMSKLGYAKSKSPKEEEPQSGGAAADALPRKPLTK